MGSGLTVIGADPIPATTDAVLVPADFSAYAEAIAHKIVHWVTDQAERDVLYAAALAPVWVASPNALWLKTSGSGGSSVWATVWADSGPVSAGFTNGADFIYTGGFVRKLNSNFVQYTIQTQRKNSDLVINAYNHATSPGNIIGDPVMLTFPSGYWPVIATPGVFRESSCDGVVEVDTSGNLKILSGTANGEIQIDSTVTVTGCFFTP